MSFCSRILTCIGESYCARCCQNNNCNCCTTQVQNLNQVGDAKTIQQQPTPSPSSAHMSSSVISLQSEKKQTFCEMYLKAFREFSPEAMSIFSESLVPPYVSNEVKVYFETEGWKEGGKANAEYEAVLCDLFMPFLDQLKELRKALMLQTAREKMQELEAKSRDRSLGSMQSLSIASGFCLESALHEKPKVSCLNDFGNTIFLEEIKSALFSYMDEICECTEEEREAAFDSIERLIKENMSLGNVRRLVLEDFLKDLETKFKKPDLEKLKKIKLTSKSGEEVPFDEELLIADLKSVCANLDKALENTIIIRVELQIEDLMPTAKVLEFITKEIHRFPSVELEQIDPEIEEALQEFAASDSRSSSSSGLRGFAEQKLKSLYGKVYGLHSKNKRTLRAAAHKVHQFVRSGVVGFLPEVKEEDV